MRYIPTYCDDCGGCALVSGRDVIEGFSWCSTCNGRARSLPGESYAREDAELFTELGRSLREAGVTPASASHLAQELEIRKFGQPGRALRQLVRVLPALGLLELVVPNQPASMRKLEGMLAVLLDAISGTQKYSSIVPAVDFSLSNADGRETG